MTLERFDADADDPLSELAVVLLTLEAAEFARPCLDEFVENGDVAVLSVKQLESDRGPLEEVQLKDLQIVTERGIAQWYVVVPDDDRPSDMDGLMDAAVRSFGSRLLIISKEIELNAETLGTSTHLDLDALEGPTNDGIEKVLGAHLRSVTGEHRTELQKTIEPLIPEIAEAARKHTEFDLRHYKRGTLLRRISRRIQIAGSEDAAHYLAQLSVDADEAAELVQSMLIGVTSFFRDPGAFESLGRIVKERLRADGHHEGNEPFRVWVPGCAAGEEAFSLVILLTEVLEGLGSTREVRLFATDFNHKSLAIARRGEYGPAIEEHVGPERLARFFQRRGERWRARPEVRERITFSLHNLINDAPLNRMDLVSCRNLLIYLGPHLQRKLFPLLHYALRPGGLLFLGTSESALRHKRLFELLDAGANVSVSRGAAVIAQPLVSGTRTPSTAPLGASDNRAGLLEVMNAVVVDEFMPPSVLVDEDGQVRTASADMSRFLSVSAGSFRNNVISLARGGLRHGLRSALAEAAEYKRRTVADRLWMKTDEGLQQVSITVQPMPRAGTGVGLYLVVFSAVGLPRVAADSMESRSAADPVILDLELTKLRLEYESSLQRLESANEELNSTNEELISMNEELRSTNDELTASKEEVERGRRHLETVYAELDNLIRSTDVATVFLDEEEHILRFTPSAQRVFNLRDGDLGRPLSDVTARARSMPLLKGPASEAPVRIELDDGTVVQRRISPLKGASGAVMGLVVNFDDVTEIDRAARDMERQLEVLKSVYASAGLGLALLDNDWSVVSGNHEFADLGGRPADLLPGAALSQVMPKALVECVQLRGEAVFDGSSPEQRFEVSGSDQEGNSCTWRVTIRPLVYLGTRDGIILAVDDITSRVAVERAAHESREFLRSLVNGANVMLAVCDSERRIVECNTPALEAAGVTLEEIEGAHFEEASWWHHSPETQAELRGIVEQGLLGETTFAVFPFQAGDGSNRYVDLRCSPLPDSRGAIEHVVVSGFDITERRELFEQLKINIRRLELSLSAVRMGTWWWYYDGNELTWDDAQRQLWDVSDEDPISLDLAKERIHPGDRQLVMETMERAIAEQATYDLHFRIILRDGSARWLGARGEVFQDQEDGRNVLLGVNWDITEERQRANELYESQRLQRLGFQSARIGTVEIMPGADQVTTDKRGAQLLGLTGVQDVSLSGLLASAVSDEDRDRVGARLQKAATSKQQGHFSIEFRTTQKVSRGKGDQKIVTDRWVRLQGRRETSAPESGGPPVVSVKLQGVVMDVSRQRENELALQTAREAAEAANRAKSEFLANMSHEIRTPMTAILGYADVLSRHLKDPDNRELVTTIRRNGDFLLDIINDILDLAKIESGALPIQLERFAPERIVEDVASLMHVRALESGIELVVHYAEPLPRMVESDPIRIRQVLLNLIGNAIKFTDQGTVTVRVSAPGSGDKSRLLIEVIDTGIGIAEADIGTLFQPFTQADNSLRRPQGGTGLGLTISRRLCRALDGDLTVTSTPGVGSTFAFSLPLRLPNEERWLPVVAPGSAHERSEEENPISLEGQTVLIVDDRRDVRTLVQFLFEDEGAETVLASNGEEALQVYQAGASFDLIVMDMQMPVMDGYAATAELRQLGATLPIIAVTAHAMQGEREKCIEAGCSDYATKPIDGERLLGQAAVLLGLRRARTDG